MAELKPAQPTAAISLSRWSRLKRAAADEQAARALPVEALVVAETGNDGPSANANASIDVAANAEYAELPPMSGISLAEDFTPFMQAKVPQALKQQALKALFKEPHFNVMDGLDIYIDDYTVFEPISPEVMATLSSWKTIMNPPQQVVTNGGYAVDVESEEGKAVLAARAELAEANAALPRSDPSTAAQEGMDVEGGGSAESTSKTSGPSSADETLLLRDVAPAVALAPAFSSAAGEAVKPHPRYGKRVGDFSASAHDSADDAAREDSAFDRDPTAIDAPKSVTQ